MLRRLVFVGLAAVLIGACGSGSSSPSASTAASPTLAATMAPTAEPTAQPTPGPTTGPTGATTMSAACNAVGLRKLPSSKGALIVRLGAGTQVRVVEIVAGDAYTAGACGTAGDTWLKIDQVGGKGVKGLYGVPFAYAAAGFFK
jgi:hypothetical protein